MDKHSGICNTRDQKTKTRLNPKRDIKELMKMRKTMRKKLETTKDQTEKNTPERQNKNNKRAHNKQEKSRSNKTKKIPEGIRENVNKGGKIWEVKKIITRKKRNEIPNKK